LQQFHFHLSLTGSVREVPAEVLAALVEEAARWFGAQPPLTVDRLSVFVQPSIDADFQLLEQWPFDA
jgi:hypothetical protein